MSKPNFYILNAFIDFSADQLEKLMASVYFSPINIIEQFGKKDGPSFYKEIVENIITLSARLALSEIS